MAMKDLLGRFNRQPIPPEEPVEQAPVEQAPSFVFTDINSEPIGPSASEPVSEPVSEGPVRVNNPYDNDRIQTFEINLGSKSKVTIPDEEPVETYRVPAEPEETYTIPAAEEVPVAPAAPSAPVVPETSAVDDYEVDFGYDALGALDDVYTQPSQPAAPVEPEPVVYTRSVAEDAGEPDYYDSYAPQEEAEYAPKNFFGVGGPAKKAKADPNPVPTIEEFPVEEDEYTDTYDAPAYDAVDESAASAAEPATYAEEQPRYENYRKDYRNTTAEGEPRSYENNIDETVFLPDEGDAPVRGGNSRRKLLASIIAMLLALLVILTAVLITHHNGSSDSNTGTTSRTSLFAALKDKDKDKTEEATEAEEKTTAFERSVSNNAEATTTTTEAPSSTIGETTTRTSTSRRSSTSSGTTTTATGSTTTTTTTTTATTTQNTGTTTTTATTTTATTTTRTTRDNNPAHSGLNQ